MRGARGIARVSAKMRSAEERQAAYVLGTGRVLPRGPRLAATAGGVSRRTEAERAKRLGTIGTEALGQGPAAAFSVRPSPLRRASEGGAGVSLACASGFGFPGTANSPRSGRLQNQQSPRRKEARLAAVMAAKSRYMLRRKHSRRSPKTSQNSEHSAMGAKLSATAR